MRVSERSSHSNLSDRYPTRGRRWPLILSTQSWLLLVRSLSLACFLYCSSFAIHEQPMTGWFGEYDVVRLVQHSIGSKGRSSSLGFPLLSWLTDSVIVQNSLKAD